MQASQGSVRKPMVRVPAQAQATILLLAALMAWQIFAGKAGSIANLYLSSPLDVAQHLRTHASDVFASLSVTLFDSLAGLAVALGFSLPAAAIHYILSKRHPSSARSFLSTLVMSQVVPIFCFVPLLSVISGPQSFGSRVILVAIYTFYPVFQALRLALSRIAAARLETAQMLSFDISSKVRHIVIPGTLHYFIGGLKTACPYAVAGALIAEISVGCSVGLGKDVLFGDRQLNAARLMMAAVLAAGLALLLYTTIAIIERATGRWYDREAAE